MGTTSSKGRQNGYYPPPPQPFQLPRTGSGGQYPVYPQQQIAYPQAYPPAVMPGQMAPQFFPPAFPQPYYPMQPVQPQGVVYVERRRKSKHKSSRRRSSRRPRRESNPTPPSRPATGMDYRSADHASSSGHHHSESAPVIPDMSRSHHGHSRVGSMSAHAPPAVIPRASDRDEALDARLLGSVHFNNTNVLPEPPRDVYQQTPHRQVLDMPGTAGLLAGAMSDRMASQAQSRKGLMGFLRGRKKQRDNTVYVPVPFQAGGDPSTDGFAALARQAEDHVPRASTSNQGHHPQDAYGRPPPMTPALFSSELDPIFFGSGSDNQYPEFELHSSYQVHYRDRSYPTAYHLFEALKFIDTHPDIAELVRTTMHLHDLAVITTQNHHNQPADWNEVVLDKLDMCQEEKFRQHPNLQQSLKDTGLHPLVYRHDDPYWGATVVDGVQQGENKMGASLMNVRQKLRIS